MDLSHGGHLTHGAPVSHMGKIFNFVRYKTHPEEQGRIDFDELRRLALEHRPKIVLCGYTSYPRDYDYADFKQRRRRGRRAHHGRRLARRRPDRRRRACATRSTTASTSSPRPRTRRLRGPRGGMVLCTREARARRSTQSVFPGLQGGPHMNTIAGVAVTLEKALRAGLPRPTPRRCSRNAKALAQGAARPRRHARHRRHRQPHDGARHRAELRHRRPRRRGDARRGRASRPTSRSSPTTRTRRCARAASASARPPPRRAASAAPRWIGWRAGSATRCARHQDAAFLASLQREVETLCLAYPVPGLPALETARR